jgi:hypothetical protein
MKRELVSPEELAEIITEASRQHRLGGPDLAVTTEDSSLPRTGAGRLELGVFKWRDRPRTCRLKSSRRCGPK